jgi:hypothetical protein
VDGAGGPRRGAFGPSRGLGFGCEARPPDPAPLRPRRSAWRLWRSAVLSPRRVPASSLRQPAPSLRRPAPSLPLPEPLHSRLGQPGDGVDDACVSERRSPWGALRPPLSTHRLSREPPRTRSLRHPRPSGRQPRRLPDPLLPAFAGDGCRWSDAGEWRALKGTSPIRTIPGRALPGQAPAQPCFGLESPRCWLAQPLGRRAASGFCCHVGAAWLGPTGLTRPRTRPRRTPPRGPVLPRT